MNTLVLVAAAAAVASFFLLLWTILRSDTSNASLRQEVTGTVSALSRTLGAAVTAHGTTQR